MTGFAVALEREPQVALQLTAVLAVLVTVAVKACVLLVTRLTLEGAIPIATGVMAVMVALADLLLSALLVAITVQVVADAGAV